MVVGDTTSVVDMGGEGVGGEMDGDGTHKNR